jgi:predicted metal-binding protein
MKSISTQDKKYRKLKKIALEGGASRVAVFPASKVVIDDRIKIKCEVPQCENLRKNLMCYTAPDVERMKKLIRLYKIAILIQTVHPVETQVDKQGHGSVIDAYASSVPLHKIINKVESAALMMGFGYAVGIIGGPCKLCDKCVGPFSGEQCRHPFMSRPSMESVGMDVALIAKKAGLPFDVPVVKEVVWNGIILLE